MADGSDHFHPVFPQGGYHMGGLTLRDYFAVKALQSLGTSSLLGGGDDDIAKEVYGIADAMMKERTKVV